MLTVLDALLTVEWTVSRGNLLISKKVLLRVRRLPRSYGSMLPYQGNTSTDIQKDIFFLCDLQSSRHIPICFFTVTKDADSVVLVFMYD
jgi:hypothetical protein